jgi:ribosomal-protein-alanine N-acetyltransferase
VIERFETERLVGTRLTDGAATLLHLIFENPTSAATLGGVRTAEETRQILLRFLAHWVGHGYGPWTLAEKPSEHLIGYAGLMHVTTGPEPGIELLYAILPGFWHRGLASEAARAVVYLAFEDLALPELIGYTLTTNSASHRVFERCGFRFEKELLRGDLPHRFYRLRSVDWARDAIA